MSKQKDLFEEQQIEMMNAAPVEHSEETKSDAPKIFTAINAIMSDLSHIGKDRKNQQQGFMFRGIDQVMNTMKPLLAKHGVFVVTEVIEQRREERTTKSGGQLIYSILTIRHHFTATDGSEVVTTTIGEGMDSADKASNKAMAIAFKYACFQIFCIPTEEMSLDDPDLYVHEVVDESGHIIDMVSNCNSREELTTLWNTYPEYQKRKNVQAAFTKRGQELKGVQQP